MNLFDAGPLPAEAEQLYAAMPRAEVAVSECDCKSPCAILIDGEGQGVRSRLRGAAFDVRIPNHRVESLNAAMAAGILLHEARRQSMVSLVKIDHRLWDGQSCSQPAEKPTGPSGKRVRSLKSCPTSSNRNCQQLAGPRQEDTAMSPFDTGPLTAEADCKSPCAILIGGEGQGVRSPLRDGALDVRIPAGILLQEAHRQRKPQ